jgi:hypothetical protein
MGHGALVLSSAAVGERSRTIPERSRRAGRRSAAVGERSRTIPERSRRAGRREAERVNAVVGSKYGA